MQVLHQPTDLSYLSQQCSGKEIEVPSRKSSSQQIVRNRERLLNLTWRARQVPRAVADKVSHFSHIEIVQRSIDLIKDKEGGGSEAGGHGRKDNREYMKIVTTTEMNLQLNQAQGHL